MRWVWLLSLTLLWACAAIPGPYSCNPPARYDYEPKEYYVRNFAPAELDAWCGARAKACTFFKTIYIRNDLPVQWRACVLRHEKGHVNGWPATHPME